MKNKTKNNYNNPSLSSNYMEMGVCALEENEEYEKGSATEVDYGTWGESWGNFWDEEDEEGCELDGTVSGGFSAIVDQARFSVFGSQNLKMNKMKIWDFNILFYSTWVVS